MDPITDVFAALHVASAVYGSLEATAPWGVRARSGPYAKFGMVVRGSCWLTVEGIEEPAQLTTGDCFLLPHGSAHALQDHPDTPTQWICEIVKNGECGEDPVLRYGGGGEATTVIAGKMLFEGPSAQPLRESLPPLIHVRGSQTRCPSLQTTMQLLVAELSEQQLGSEVVINRLADVLFLQAIRAHIATGENTETGWLRAVSDPQIGPAIRGMHENVAHPWTVGLLAAAAGMSRSAFALRFKALVGEAPLEYLTRWRMCKAGHLLRGSDRNLMDVANLVGYESDGAFKRTFKRVLGITPGEYRRMTTTSPVTRRQLETFIPVNWGEARQSETAAV